MSKFNFRDRPSSTRTEGRGKSTDRLARREFLMLGAATAAIGAAAMASAVEALALSVDQTAEAGEVTLPTNDAGWAELTDREWRKILSADEFYVLREEGTERAFTSPLNDEKRVGNFHCAGCDLALYPSNTKYDSRTGWPSFWAPLSDDVIGTKRDFKLILPRTEVHCSRCNGHLGHIFNDGPAPTGKRHCLNGIALSFKPAVA